MRVYRASHCLRDCETQPGPRRAGCITSTRFDPCDDLTLARHWRSRTDDPPFQRYFLVRAAIVANVLGDSRVTQTRPGPLAVTRCSLPINGLAP